MRELKSRHPSSQVQKAHDGETEYSWLKSRRGTAENVGIFKVSQRNVRPGRPMAACVRVLQGAATTIGRARLYMFTRPRRTQGK